MPEVGIRGKSKIDGEIRVILGLPLSGLADAVKFDATSPVFRQEYQALLFEVRADH